MGGGLTGGVLIGLYLWATHVVFGRHPNEVFASQHIMDFKNFLRMKMRVASRALLPSPSAGARSSSSATRLIISPLTID